MPDLICRGCGGRFYETTDLFDNIRPIFAGMFKMKSPWSDKYRWPQFPPDNDGTGGYGNLCCPDCETQYANSYGFAIVDGYPEHVGPMTEDEVLSLAKKMEAIAELKRPVSVQAATNKQAEPVITNYYVCPFCDDSFTDRKECRSHMAEVHSKKLAKGR